MEKIWDKAIYTWDSFEHHNYWKFSKLGMTLDIGYFDANIILVL